MLIGFVDVEKFLRGILLFCSFFGVATAILSDSLKMANSGNIETFLLLKLFLAKTELSLKSWISYNLCPFKNIH